MNLLQCGLQVLLALCSRLHTIQQLRKGLSNRLHAVKALAAPEGDKQQLIDQVVNTLHLQLRGTAQVGAAGPAVLPKT
jgi:hypothetical protein